MYKLQLTRRKHLFQVELFTTPACTRVVVSPRFVSLNKAKQAFNHIENNLSELRQHLLVATGTMYAQKPTNIYSEVYFE